MNSVLGSEVKSNCWTAVNSVRTRGGTVESTSGDCHLVSECECGGCGHGRVDHSFQYPVENDGVMKIYAPSRTGLVFGKATPLAGV
jgi:hypothetical protein